MSRTLKSAKNFIIAVICQFIGIIFSFLARYFFVRILSKDYLGLNGLFTNILTILSFAELGIGTAITYSLYKPISENDFQKCKMLMCFYKRVYTIIGIVVLILGLLITPFIKFLINDIPIIQHNIYIIYILFVINTAISYFFSYKRSFIIADQNRYVASIVRYSCYILTNVFQIIYLYLSKDYYGFLILQIIFTFLENIIVSIFANKMYPFLNNNDKIALDDSSKNEILKNTKALIAHKVGGIAVSSTDNILLSKIVNLSSVGIYSNYYMITYALNLFYNQLYSSLTPSIGNLCVNSNCEKKYSVFKNIDFITFFLYSFSSVMLLLLYNDFITLWLSSDYLFSFDIVLIIVINFYFTGMRNSVLSFRNATGLFYNDRLKPLFEAVINLTSSIFLGIKFGVLGIFIGTFISTITTCFWIEPYILYKNCFNKSSFSYFLTYFLRVLFTIFTYFIIKFVISFIYCNGILSFILKSFICLFTYFLIFVLMFLRCNEFKYCYSLIRSFFAAFFRR